MGISGLRRLLKDKHDQEMLYYFSESFMYSDAPSYWFGKMDRTAPWLSASYPHALLQLVNIAKDFRDTFTPYKTPRHVTRDKWQLFTGILNLFSGLLLFFTMICLLPLVVGITLFVLPINFLLRSPEPNMSIAKNPMVWLHASGAILLTNLALVLRGTTQIITAPLTLLRIGFRMYHFRNVPYESEETTKRKLAPYIQKVEDVIHEEGKKTIL